MRIGVGVCGAVAAVALAAAAGAAVAGGRVLPWKPLEDARPGEKAAYKLEVYDASGQKVSAMDKTYAVDAHEDGVVKIGKSELAEDADAKDIIGALRLLPPGTPLEGLVLKPEPVTALGERRFEGFKVSLRTKLKDGVTSVIFDAWFAKEVPVYGLVRSRTKIVGGGAGESVYEIADFKEAR